MPSINNKFSIPVDARGMLIDTSPYGRREDNTPKEQGFLGEIRMPNGRDVMTEYSTGVPQGLGLFAPRVPTPDVFRPTITPGIHPADLNYIQQTGIVPNAVYNSSLLNAKKRIAMGMSPFWNAAQDLPVGTK